jgi:hypothetical protein
LLTWLVKEAKAHSFQHRDAQFQTQLLEVKLEVEHRDVLPQEDGLLQPEGGEATPLLGGNLAAVRKQAFYISGSGGRCQELPDDGEQGSLDRAALPGQLILGPEPAQNTGLK